MAAAPDRASMQTGIGRNYREPSWLERIASGSAGRAPAWLRAPLKRAYNALLAALPGDHLICRLPGGETIRVDPAFRHLAWNAEEYDALKLHTRAGATVLDIGANVGCYTMLFARWTGEAGHVYAFEPAAESRAGLERHLALNDSVATRHGPAGSRHRSVRGSRLHRCRDARRQPARSRRDP